MMEILDNMVYSVLIYMPEDILVYSPKDFFVVLCFGALLTWITGEPEKDRDSFEKSGSGGLMPWWTEAVMITGWFIYWPVKIFRTIQNIGGGGDDLKV